MFKKILFVCSFAIALHLQAQEVYCFTKGLYANVPTHCGREAIYPDPLALQLFNGTLKAPVEDAAFGNDDSGKVIIWKEIRADSGISGMNAANANQYFAGASGFPDYMIFSLDMLQSGAKGVKQPGFYDNQWKLKTD